LSPIRREMNNATNDVAVWPPDRVPMIVAAYHVGGHRSDEERNAILADVGRPAAAL